MRTEIASQLNDAAARLQSKGLFVTGKDSLSLRVPGSEECLLIQAGQESVETVPLADNTLHGLVYRHRQDAGAVLIGSTQWSISIAGIGISPPVMYDEQARHIGKIPPIIDPAARDQLPRALAGGGNIVFCGDQCIRIGMTRDRVVFNTELFEKCAMAFVLAHHTGQPIKTIPWWVQRIAGGRLRKDQARAAAAYANGEIPAGMNAY